MTLIVPLPSDPWPPSFEAIEEAFLRHKQKVLLFVPREALNHDGGARSPDEPRPIVKEPDLLDA